MSLAPVTPSGLSDTGPAVSQATVARAFRERREPEWARLEDILKIAEKKGVRRLSDEDLLALPILYRGAISSLSLARETSLDFELVTYLEGLCARAYFFVYGIRSTPGSKMVDFFARGWPRAIQSLWRETLLALGLMIIGTIAGYLLVTGDPLWYDAFVDPGLAGDRNFEASTEQLRASLFDESEVSGLSAFASSLFTHNSRVSILCFALGFAFGIPTAILLVANTTMLGAFFALYGSHGLAFDLGGWLAIHGTTELYAILLAGAAGFHIGWAVIFPGEDSRLTAATRAGRTAANAMIGVVIMLLFAGILEGFGRQLITSTAARYTIGGIMLALWLLYFYLPRGAEGSAPRD